jgi:hypothetical protein
MFKKLTSPKEYLDLEHTLIRMMLKKKKSVDEAEC